MTIRLRRSLLICPGDRGDMHAKLARGRQDVAILDLEDGVHESAKPQGREQIISSMRDLNWNGRERIVRINSMETAHAKLDIEAAAKAGADGIMLAKTQTADELCEASRILAKEEQKNGMAVGTVKLWSMIETALGLLNIEKICFADPRMTGVLFGAGDLAVDLEVKRLSLGGFRRTGMPSNEYTYGRGKLVLAARAAGIDPFDTGNTTFGDDNLTRRNAEFSAQMGFSGAVVYHPKQIDVINDTYSPATEDVEWATEIVTKYTEANKVSKNVVVVDGEMVDGPYIILARRIIERAAAVREKQHQYEAEVRVLESGSTAS